MQRVIETLEYALDEKETLLMESKVQLERLRREKKGIDHKLGVTELAYEITNGLINSFLLSGKSESDPAVMMQRTTRNELFNEINVIVNAHKDVVVAITEVDELVRDLEIDVNEIRAFVREHKVDEGKRRKIVNFEMIVAMP